MRITDRMLIAISYALLVGIVAFLSWDIDRRLTELQAVECRIAWLEYDTASVSLSVSVAAVTATNDEAIDEVIQALEQYDDQTEQILTDLCGERPILEEE